MPLVPILTLKLNRVPFYGPKFKRHLKTLLRDAVRDANRVIDNGLTSHGTSFTFVVHQDPEKIKD